jgi:hypothetical protein
VTTVYDIVESIRFQCCIIVLGIRTEMGSRRTDRGTPAVCPDDQYFDSVVGHCCTCADVCSLPEALVFCQNNCPDYYRRMHHVEAIYTTSSSRTSFPVDRLIDKPLFWTSVISMNVALVATVGIIVLCVIRWRAAGRTGRSRHVSFLPRPRQRHGFRKGEVKSSGPEEKQLDGNILFASKSKLYPTCYSVCSEECVSLRSMPQGNDSRTVTNRLDHLTRIVSLVSDDDASRCPISRHLGTDVHVSAKTESLSIKTFATDRQQLPKHIQSIDNRPSQPIDASFVYSDGCLTSSTIPHYSSVYETSAKRLSVDDVSSDDGGLLSLTSQDSWTQRDLSTALSLVHVPGNRPRPSALHFKDEEVAVSLRSETGYRSDHVTIG